MPRYLKPIIFLWSCFSCLSVSNRALGQALAVPVIEVDSITHAIKDQVPFDRKFILKIKSAGMPTSVDYIRLKKNMTWFQTITAKTRPRVLGFIPISGGLAAAAAAKPMNAYLRQHPEDTLLRHYLPGRQYLAGFLPISYPDFDVTQIPAAAIDTGRESGKKYAYIQFDGVVDPAAPRIKKNNYLKPGNGYAIIISNFDETTNKIFQAYFDDDSLAAIKLPPGRKLTLKDTLAIFQKGDALIEANRLDQLNRFNLSYNSIQPGDAHALYFDQLRPYYQAIKALDARIRTRADTSSIKTLNRSVLLRKVIHQFTDPDPGIHIPSKYVDSLSLLNNLQTLYRINDTLVTGNADFPKGLMAGQFAFANAGSIAPPASTVTKQLKNLKASVSALQQIIQYTGLLLNRELLTDSLHDMARLRIIVSQLQQQLQDLNKKDELSGKINTAIAAKPQYVQLSVVTGSSVTFDFKTRSKLQIIPDFGYVWYGFQPGFSSFTPYLGFQVNFRPLDKNIPWNIYPNKKPWHYLSFSTGWSLTSLAKAGQRENFFTSSSLLTGLGIKLTNAVKINTGVAWFYQDDPNPVLSNRRLRCTPYAGLSLDLDIKEFLNDFTSQKPNLK